jgi:colicin import membrane protein
MVPRAADRLSGWLDSHTPTSGAAARVVYKHEPDKAKAQEQEAAEEQAAKEAAEAAEVAAVAAQQARLAADAPEVEAQQQQPSPSQAQAEPQQEQQTEPPVPPSGTKRCAPAAEEAEEDASQRRQRVAPSGELS